MQRPKPILPIFTTLVWLLGMLPAFVAITMTVMVFDAPGSENNGYLVTFVLAVVS